MNLREITPATMTSLEIAKLTGKRHDHVMADIEKMLSDLELLAPDFSGTRLVRGKKARSFNLPKRESLILVSGYCLKMRAVIIDRWQELEESKPMFPKTLPDALRMAADLAEQNQKLLPKAIALDRLSGAIGSHSLRAAAKQLNVGQKYLGNWLEANNWCFRNGKGEREAYQHRIDSGVMMARSGEAHGHSFSQPMITAKGLTKLSVVLSGHQ